MTNPDSENNFIHDLLQLLSKEGSGAFSQLLQVLLNKAMLLERSSVLEAKPYERTSNRRGYANGFKSKTLHTPLGSLSLDIPQVRCDIAFYPTAFKRKRGQGTISDFEMLMGTSLSMSGFPALVLCWIVR